VCRKSSPAFGGLGKLRWTPGKLATFSPGALAVYADIEYHNRSILLRLAPMLTRFTAMPINVNSRALLLSSCISFFSELTEETTPIKGREMRGRYLARCVWAATRNVCPLKALSRFRLRPGGHVYPSKGILRAYPPFSKKYMTKLKNACPA
jgi:hypothetical protein